MVSQTAFLTLVALVAPFTFADTMPIEDFENGWDKAAWPLYAPDCSNGGSVTLDSTTAHSGTKSIRVDGAGGYCGHAFFGTTQVPTDGDVFVRTWMKVDKALTADHVSFITHPDAALGNKHLRIGGQSAILMYNRETDDATLPELSPAGIAASAALPAGQWVCFEYRLGADGSIETWLDGTALAGLTVLTGGGAANPAAGPWTRTPYVPKVTGVYLGWEAYGMATNTIWYDDIAVASERVGCDATCS